MIIGDPRTFAIESQITEAYGEEHRSFLGMGYVLLHISERRFGIDAPDATTMFSYDCIPDRIAARGTHTAPFSGVENPQEIALATAIALYREEGAGQTFFGLSNEEFQNAIYTADIKWTADQEFDDGTNVLQFDIGDQVRLIGFINSEISSEVRQSTAEAWLSADTFYETLDHWRTAVIEEWKSLPKISR
ncbi:Imm42 family immunity protein [Lacibacterium aquatile]|uniref:Imm42 family immunity protein n=1 Tax=Lacibacterium aquatile TaxID=1168082 RepID=A0ABW5DXK3_9PROT